MDYANLRKMMVEEQLIPQGIKDTRVLGAFRNVERHRFVPENSRSNAYVNRPLSIGESQTISQPYIVALMTELLELKGEEKILEVGTGSGYQTAILALLCRQVYSIERFENLGKKAQATLDELGFNNIRIKIDDGTLGWPENGPFDRVIITAACPDFPAPLIEQLNENGLIVAPIGEQFSQVLTVAQKTKRGLKAKEICGCVFVPLIGKFAFQN